MKSFIKTFFALALSAAMLCGCMAPEKENENSAQENKPAQTGDGLRTGLYTSASYEGSSGVQGEADGLVKLQATFVAVTVDEEGRIEGLMIDQVQSETGFDAAGMLTGQAQTVLTG